MAEYDDGAEPSEPGVIVTSSNTGLTEAGPGVPEAITTSGTNYDPTTLTKFVPGGAFVAKPGEPDVADFTGTGLCVQGEVAATGGILTEVVAPVELPDGSRITSLGFFGADSAAASDIGVALRRTEFTVPFGAGVVTREDA
jgi:hypothetical protein